VSTSDGGARVISVGRPADLDDAGAWRGGYAAAAAAVGGPAAPASRIPGPAVAGGAPRSVSAQRGMPPPASLRVAGEHGGGGSGGSGPSPPSAAAHPHGFGGGAVMGGYAVAPGSRAGPAAGTPSAASITPLARMDSNRCVLTGGCARGQWGGGG
jgi:hypothetical protein